MALWSSSNFCQNDPGSKNGTRVGESVSYEFDHYISILWGKLKVLREKDINNIILIHME